ncbi:hypothetical protein NDU88_003265 [Pleurodeles waltl]|uniref:Uncharacterized protein n=1 Tax=Pleurodeles waltl TaxID=8319 RepID=A0AAV7L5L4_PLEWA|nr:hypothetical protein NDU88_003265 [Pleurodeles waltl]
MVRKGTKREVLACRLCGVCRLQNSRVRLFRSLWSSVFPFSSHPDPEIRGYVADAGVSVVMGTSDADLTAVRVAPLGFRSRS